MSTVAGAQPTGALALPPRKNKMTICYLINMIIYVANGSRYFRDRFGYHIPNVQAQTVFVAGQVERLLVSRLMRVVRVVRVHSLHACVLWMMVIHHLLKQTNEKIK